MAPEAGSTRLFHKAVRCRPVRQRASANQASVVASAATKAGHWNTGSKPGASRATLAAGLAGTPVCRDSHTTQMTMAQSVKNSTVNQSISEAMLRRKVGSAKAASVASAGSATSRARSLALVNTVVVTGTSAIITGRPRWRWRRICSSWCRQRHSVHSTSGQTGQVNHRNRRASARQSLSRAGRVICQRSRSAHTDSTAVAAVIRPSSSRVRHRSLPPISSAGAMTRPNSVRPAQISAVVGAPESASPGRPTAMAIQADQGRNWSPARPK